MLVFICGRPHSPEFVGSVSSILLWQNVCNTYAALLRIQQGDLPILTSYLPINFCIYALDLDSALIVVILDMTVLSL